MGASEESIPRPSEEVPEQGTEQEEEGTPRRLKRQSVEDARQPEENVPKLLEAEMTQELHLPEVILGHFLRGVHPEPDYLEEGERQALEDAPGQSLEARGTPSQQREEAPVTPEVPAESAPPPSMEMPPRYVPPEAEIPPPPEEAMVEAAPIPPTVTHPPLHHSELRRVHHPPPPPPKEVEVVAVSEADVELDAILSGLKTTIKIIGLGGGGSNTIGRLVESGVSGADVYACNTDAQHLLHIHSPHKILLGKRLTRGLGAGAIPQVGEDAAREAEEALKAALRGSDMLFVTCGLGGGTGTGSVSYVASLAKEMGALTIAICTWPFRAEGAVRWENAEYGLEKLRTIADTVVVVPNDKLIELVPRLSLNSAFKVADEVLMRSIKGITEIITKPGLVNLDFNDVRTIMKGGGVAMIGLGEADTENRAEEAVEEAISSPLIDVEISGATGALINVSGGPDMTVSEAERVAEIVQERINPNARIIWGAAIEPALEHRIRVMLVLTGVKSKNIFGPDEPFHFREDGVDAVR